MKIKKSVLVLISIMLLMAIGIPVNAATVTKEVNRTWTYRDWPTGVLLGTVTVRTIYSHDSVTDKLVNQKSVHVFGSVFGLIKTVKQSSYDWYNTTQINGSGQSTGHWVLTIGIPTPWGPLGAEVADDMIQTRVYGKGYWN